MIRALNPENARNFIFSKPVQINSEAQKAFGQGVKMYFLGAKATGE